MMNMKCASQLFCIMIATTSLTLRNARENIEVVYIIPGTDYSIQESLTQVKKGEQIGNIAQGVGDEYSGTSAGAHINRIQFCAANTTPSTIAKSQRGVTIFAERGATSPPASAAELAL